MATEEKQKQINFRLDEATLKLVDLRRMDLGRESGNIPTRSDVFRIALDEYLKKHKLR